MGVLGLWQLLAPVGQPVTLESLENKILAVDVSIWLNQAIKGYRDKTGGTVANAHLLSLFSRLCKLLFYKIRPIIVFDGGVPDLKRQTIVDRQKSRATLHAHSKDAALKLLANYIASKNLGKNINSSPMKKSFAGKAALKDDIFILPPLQKNADGTEHHIDFDEKFELRHEDLAGDAVKYLDEIDIESKDFNDLPPEIKQEILATLRESRKYRNWEYYEELPKESDEFSNYQMQSLLKRRKLQSKMEDIQHDVRKSQYSDIIALYAEDDMVGEPSKIMSDESSHFLYLKKISCDKKAKPCESSSSGSASVSNLAENAKSEPNTEQLHHSIAENSFVIKEHEIGLESKTDEDLQTATDNEAVGNVIEEVDIISSEEAFIVDQLIQKVESQRESITAVDNGKIEPLELPQSLQTNFSSEVVKIKPLQDATDVRNDAEFEIVDMFPNSEEFTPVSNHIASHDDVVISEHDSEQPAVYTVSVPTNSDAGSIVSGNQLSSSVSDETTAHVSVSELNSPVQKARNKTGSYTTLRDEIEAVNLAVLGSLKAEAQLPRKEAEQEKEVIAELLASKAGCSVNDKRQNGIQDTIVEPSTLQEEWAKHEEEAKILDELEAESSSLLSERAKQERQASTVQEHMYEECKDLLRLFGIPYVVGAMEAEAQCAFFDHEAVTDGTITDDSDVWLFGGKRVYKNFFTQDKFVEFYKEKEILSHFSLNRLKLIVFAMLTGSDYTEGIEGVGPVTAMEIISEFPGEGFEILQEFRKWWDEANKCASPPKNKVRSKFQKFQLTNGFPSRTVFEAYLQPTVDQSTEAFSWGIPDLDSLRDYTKEKFGWSKVKVDGMLLPVLKRLNERTKQTHLDKFFSVSLRKEKNLFPSKRIMSALKKITATGESEEECDEPSKKSKGKRVSKPKQRAVLKRCSKKQSKPANRAKRSLKLSEESSEETT